MIARPARVRIRARKPCLRFRRRVFGWYVRFMLVLECHQSAGVATGHEQLQPLGGFSSGGASVTLTANRSLCTGN
jgi:hypothetical protein